MAISGSLGVGFQNDYTTASPNETQSKPPGFISRSFSTIKSTLGSFSKEPFKNWSFPSVREGISTFTSWAGSQIKLGEGSATLATSEPPGNIPSSALFRKSVGGILRRTLTFNQNLSVRVSYKLLTQKLDEYHGLPKNTASEINTALACLASLKGHVAAIQSKSGDTSAVTDLNTSLQTEQKILTLQKGIMEQIDPEFAESNEVHFVKDVAGGNLSTVSSVTYKNGKSGFFKPVDAMPLSGTQGARVGIPSTSSLEASLADRNVLSYEVSQLLPGDLVPETTFASHQGQVGSFQATARGGAFYQEEKKSIPYSNRSAEVMKACQETVDSLLIMRGQLNSLTFVIKNSDSSLRLQEERIYRDADPITEEECVELYKKGEVGMEAKFTTTIENINFADPSLQKAMANAHIFDFLTGQVDRNPGNFFYEKLEEGGYKLHLIDNDQSFPAQFTDFSDKIMDQFSSGCALKELPRLVDQEMAQTIMELDPAKITSLLIKRGRTGEETKATLGRLQGLKEHIQNIQAGKIEGGQIVSNWNDDTFTQLQKKEDNYIFRSLEDRSALERQKARLDKSYNIAE